MKNVFWAGARHRPVLVSLAVLALIVVGALIGSALVATTGSPMEDFTSTEAPGNGTDDSKPEENSLNRGKGTDGEGVKELKDIVVVCSNVRRRPDNRLLASWPDGANDAQERHLQVSLSTATALTASRETRTFQCHVRFIKRSPLTFVRGRAHRGTVRLSS